MSSRTPERNINRTHNVIGGRKLDREATTSGQRALPPCFENGYTRLNGCLSRTRSRRKHDRIVRASAEFVRANLVRANHRKGVKVLPTARRFSQRLGDFPGGFWACEGVRA